MTTLTLRHHTLEPDPRSLRIPTTRIRLGSAAVRRLPLSTMRFAIGKDTRDTDNDLSAGNSHANL